MSEEPMIKPEIAGGFYAMPWWQPFLLSTTLAVVLTLTGVWQLIVVAGFVGGILPKKLTGRRAFALGWAAGTFAWMMLFSTYAVTTELMTFVTRVFEDLSGIPGGVVFLIFLLCSALGGVFCGAGAVNGVFIGRILQQVKNRN